MNTIFAPITGFGGAVFTIRISGDDSLNCIGILCKKNIELHHMKACVLDIFDGEDFLDKIVLNYFKAPNSFTGFDCIEISLHASRYIIDKVLEILSKIKDFRYATNGEFTKQAFLNGKIDIVESEGINSLIRSITKEQHKISASMVDGSASGFYNDIRNRLIKILSIMEINIDFSDEEIPEREFLFMKNEIEDLKRIIQKSLNQSCFDKVFNGIKVAIVGNANVGKSSLINFLSQKQVSIVYDREGTTRDVVYTDVVIDGNLIRFFDTAGIRKTTDEIELIGIEKSLNAKNEADFSIIMTSVENYDESLEVNENDIFLINKIDLKSDFKKTDAICVSLVKNTNLEELLTAIKLKINKVKGESGSFCMNLRHKNNLEKALSVLNEINFNDGIELQYENIRFASVCLENITGVVCHDDVLNSVFSSFCVGK